MKEAKPLPKRIVPSTIGKSTLSFLLDFAFTIALMFILYYSVGVPAILNNNDYYPAIAEETSYVESSRILNVTGEGAFAYFQYSDDESTKPEDYAYKKYLDRIWDYFMVAIPANPNIEINNTVTSTIDSTEIPGYTGVADPSSQDYGRWVYAHYLGYVEGADNNSFVPSEEGNYTSAPVSLKEDKYHNALRAELFDDGTSPYKGHYVDAVAHLSTQSAISVYARRINSARYASTVPSFAIAPLIFFFILPLCLPGGKTLGKLICGMAVIDYDGYSARKFQIILRQAIITLMWMILALPWYVVSLPLFTLLMLLDYMVHVMSKKHQSLHDMAAGTVAIDAKKSIWFTSEEQEKSFIEEHPMSPISRALNNDKEPDAVSVATSAMIEAEEKILDLSTINKRREEARKMTSFDEFEKKSDAEFAKREEELKTREDVASAEEEPVDEEAQAQALKDMAMLEGLTEEEAALMQEGAEPEEAQAEKENDEDLDGFVDEKEKE